ncbi:MAG: GGDEF domain-containing protein [Candidatus Gracilibacteria bacterium]|nr:GGDEF domain-containing protein [Candidatus Gracilibacteria bacterium]
MHKKKELDFGERREILKQGTIGLNEQIKNYSKKVQDAIYMYYGQDGIDKPSEELIYLTKGKFLKDFFSSLELKFKRTTFFDKKVLLIFIKNLLEKYFNGVENQDGKTQIKIYNVLPKGKGILDITEKTDDNRMIHFSNNEFINNFKGYNYIKDLITKKSYIDFQEMDTSSGLITIDTFDSGEYILYFKGLDEFQLEIVQRLAHDFIGLLKSKITEIEYRYTNPITKLKNINFFMAQANKKNYSVYAIDLNNFKYINDIYGHKQGDKVLNKFGELLKSCIRENEGEVVHLSGDEFAILINLQKDEDENSKITQSINTRIKKLINSSGFVIELRNPETNEEDLIEIGFSTGLYENKNRNQTLEVCYSNADILMYENKGTTGLEHRIIKLSKRIKEENEQLRVIQNLSTQFGFDVITRDDGSFLVIPKSSEGTLLN